MPVFPQQGLLLYPLCNHWGPDDILAALCRWCRQGWSCSLLMSVTADHYWILFSNLHLPIRILSVLIWWASGFQGELPWGGLGLLGSTHMCQGEKTDGMKTLYPYRCDLFGVAFIWLISKMKWERAMLCSIYTPKTRINLNGQDGNMGHTFPCCWGWGLKSGFGRVTKAALAMFSRADDAKWITMSQVWCAEWGMGWMNCTAPRRMKLRSESLW